MGDTADGTSLFRVSYAMIWHYYMCHRQVWLMAHCFVPDREEPGTLLRPRPSEQPTGPELKMPDFEFVKFDTTSNAIDGNILIAELKRSSRYLQSARMHLLFFLDEFRRNGLRASGELRIKREGRRETVRLGKREQRELERVKAEVVKLAYLPRPPKATKTQWCRDCAYSQFCWA
jgi:CRISPR-associated exonuclease Cas4